MRAMPVPPVRLSTEDKLSYAQRMLSFVLSTSCTATLSDEQIELSLSASQLAVTAADISVTALSRLSDVRQALMRVQTYRRTLEPVAVQPEPAKPTPNPSGGHRSRLIAPVPSLPSPGRALPVPKVDIAF